MYYVDDTGAAVAPPTPAPVGNPGWFQPEDAAAGTAATLITVDFLNMCLAEGLNLLALAGLTPSKTNNAQQLQAVAATSWFGGRARFTSSGTWTCPPNVYKVRLRLWGSGGAGGTDDGTGAGGGGGAGGMADLILPVVPGEAYAVTVGAAGAASQVLYFETTLAYANAGTGGAGSTGGGVGAGGAGGTAGGNDANGLYFTGSSGSNGVLFGDGGLWGGQGGAAAAGPGPAWGAAGSTSTPTVGNIGSFPGGGGSGGIAGRAGGPGAAGLALLEW